MSKIAYVLLCHKDPSGIIAQARRLTAAGDFVSIHFDGRAREPDYDRIRIELADNPSVTFAARRLKCGWGEWSLVAATLEALKAAERAFPEATHFYMLSGDCMCIKSAEYAHAFLDAEDVDYIESFDFHESGWIKTGIKEERLIYRHWFNEREQQRLFYASLALQQRFNLRREIPADIEVMIGSQWWCLRRATVEKVLEFVRRRPDVVDFFSTTWIPDETFFQTVVRHLVPTHQIRTRTLTFLMFTDYGMPVTFHDDHYDMLLSQDYLFARKLSPGAAGLKSKLGELYTAEGREFVLSSGGREMFRFLTERGRVGRRFASRFWETGSSIGRDRTLLVVVCKKWHVAKRLVDRIGEGTDIPVLHYLFNEEHCAMPDLGGIETSMAKRSRHRRALLRMIFDGHGSDRLVICVDPGSAELIRDFYAERSRVRVLEVQCEFSDDYLLGHARRVGLVGDSTPRDVVDRLLPTIRQDMRHESERLQEADLEGFFRIEERRDPDMNAPALAAFLGVERATAREILDAYHLFMD